MTGRTGTFSSVACFISEYGVVTRAFYDRLSNWNVHLVLCAIKLNI
ncbi:MAG: hypothetical protein ACPG8D_04260 [Luminiphilus sp.]